MGVHLYVVGRRLGSHVLRSEEIYIVPHLSEYSLHVLLFFAPSFL